MFPPLSSPSTPQSSASCRRAVAAVAAPDGGGGDGCSRGGALAGGYTTGAVTGKEKTTEEKTEGQGDDQREEEEEGGILYGWGLAGHRTAASRGAGGGSASSTFYSYLPLLTSSPAVDKDGHCCFPTQIKFPTQRRFVAVAADTGGVFAALDTQGGLWAWGSLLPPPASSSSSSTSVQRVPVLGGLTLSRTKQMHASMGGSSPSPPLMSAPLPLPSVFSTSTDATATHTPTRLLPHSSETPHNTSPQPSQPRVVSMDVGKDFIVYCTDRCPVVVTAAPATTATTSTTSHHSARGGATTAAAAPPPPYLHTNAFLVLYGNNSTAAAAAGRLGASASTSGGSSCESGRSGGVTIPLMIKTPPLSWLSLENDRSRSAGQTTTDDDGDGRDRETGMVSPPLVFSEADDDEDDGRHIPGSGHGQPTGMYDDSNYMMSAVTTIQQVAACGDNIVLLSKSGHMFRCDGLTNTKNQTTQINDRSTSQYGIVTQLMTGSTAPAPLPPSSSSSSSTPPPPGTLLPPMRYVSLGTLHGAAITADGQNRLFVWGDGLSGNLGLGHPSAVSPPPLLSASSHVVTNPTEVLFFTQQRLQVGHVACTRGQAAPKRSVMTMLRKSSSNTHTADCSSEHRASLSDNATTDQMNSNKHNRGGVKWILAGQEGPRTQVCTLNDGGGLWVAGTVHKGLAANALNKVGACEGETVEDLFHFYRVGGSAMDTAAAPATGGGGENKRKKTSTPPAPNPTGAAEMLYRAGTSGTGRAVAAARMGMATPEDYGRGGNTGYLSACRVVWSQPCHIHSMAIATRTPSRKEGGMKGGELFTWGCGSDGRLGIEAFFNPKSGDKRLLKCYVSTPTRVEGLLGPGLGRHHRSATATKSSKSSNNKSAVAVTASTTDTRSSKHVDTMTQMTGGGGGEVIAAAGGKWWGFAIVR